MEKFLRHFERAIVLVLLVLMMIVVLLGTVELAVNIISEMVSPPQIVLLDINDMIKIFGFFLMILIGLELIETIKVYLHEQSVHVEIIFLVAIIAITRKVIILEIYGLQPLTLLGVAAIILSLSVGYYFVKKGLRE